MGMTTMCEIMAKMSRGTINSQDPVSKAVTDKFRTVDFSCILQIFIKMNIGST